MFRILIPLFTSSLQFLVQLVRATLAQLLGYACPDVRLRVSDLAVTVSVRFCGGRFDSFLGFEYVSYYKPVLFAHFGFIGGHMV